MSLKTLVRESEPYSQYGNISADGIQKLLGAPNTDRLQTVIRESVQNSWDARTENCIPEYRINIRKLTEHQIEILKTKIFYDLPVEGKGQHPLDRSLSTESVFVIEISDYGTSGLGGPVKPDEISENHEAPDFVDFVRNIGTPRDTMHGGGTYGYGKSSLYAFSKCNTILVDSVARYKGKPVRRFMGARVSHRYDIDKGDERGKYTGRHWWGIKSRDATLEPLNENSADHMANALGFAKRGVSDFGTSIMILAPDFADTPVSEVMCMIKESLLVNFWPKMLEHENGTSPMKFRIECNGAKYKLPDIDNCPPLNLFAQAIRKIHRNAGEVETITSGHGQSKITLGKLVIEKNIKQKRHEFLENSNGLFSNSVSHVALMRPAELVIKYLEGQPFPSEGFEWGGVFICDGSDDVEKAFASSEPPAHDDWNPNFLPKGPLKTYVNVALKRIKEQMKLFVFPVLPVDSAGERISLAEVGDKLGSILFQSTGQGVGVGAGPEKSRKNGKKKAVKIGKPQFKQLMEYKGETCALFEIKLAGPKNRNTTIVAQPTIVVDGGIEKSMPDGNHPKLIGWRDEAGNLLGEGDELTTSFRHETIEVLVSVPGYVAVSLNVHMSSSL